MKLNDEVICIDNKPNGSSYIMKHVPLTIGKSYVVQSEGKSETIRILDDENMFKDYRKDRFVTQSEWLQRQRDNKLNQLGI